MKENVGTQEETLPENRQTSKKPYLVTPGEIYKLTSDFSPVDSQGYEEEGRKILEKLAKFRLPLVFPEGFDHWVRLDDELLAIGRFQTQFEKEHMEKIDRGEITYKEWWSDNALLFGLMLLTREILEKQISLAKKNGFEDEFAPYANLESFNYTGALLVQIREMSILDLKNNNHPSKFSPAAFFRFLVESQLIDYKDSYDEIVQNQPEYPWHSYPYTTKNHLQNTQVFLNAAINLTPLEVKTIMAKYNTGHLERTAAAAVKKIIERIWQLRSQIQPIILNPKSDEFPQLKKVFEHYLTESDLARECALFIGTTNFKEFYRKAQEEAQNPNYYQFYKLLQTAISESVEENPFTGLLTSDDLQTILDTEREFQMEVEKVPTLPELGQMVASIFSKSSTKKYQVNPETIDWFNFIRPQEAWVEFGQIRPQKFEVALFYRSKTGESLKLVLLIDTKRNYDWQILNSPSELLTIYQTLLIITRSILLEVANQADEQYHQRQIGITEQPAREPIVLPREKTPRTAAITREPKVLPEEKGGTVPRRLIPEVILVEKKEVRNQIMIPEEEKVLEKMLARLSPIDQQIVRERIQEFNKRGVGRFKMLDATTPDGQSLFSFRINTVGGGVRVLLTEIESLNGLRHFQVVDIDYRKEIYRRWQI